jgi:two-component system alkaline phosphatase synthesis response regulator PhoP
MPQRTVLMIDDESNARKVTKLLLEREGFRVLTAATGDEGLILAKVERPHVILLDVMMPKMNGYETLKRLRDDQDTAAVPVIMVTARGTEHDIATSFRLGAVFHIEKPYETRDLLQKITVALTLPDDTAG